MEWTGTRLAELNKSWSWPEQVKSMRRLASHHFSWCYRDTANACCCPRTRWRIKWAGWSSACHGCKRRFPLSALGCPLSATRYPALNPRYGSLSRQRLQKRRCLPEPRSLAPLEVSGQRVLLGEQALRPLAGLGGAALVAEEAGVVVLRFRQRRGLRGFGEQLRRALAVSALRMRKREQAEGASVVVLAGVGDNALQVLRGRGPIAQLQFGEGAAIVVVRRAGARRDRLGVSLARFGKAPFLAVQVGQLLIVSRRGIVEDDGLQLANALAPRKDFERLLHQHDVGRGLNQQVGERAESAAQEDDPEPVVFGTAAREVNQRQQLQNDAVSEEQPHWPGL